MSGTDKQLECAIIIQARISSTRFPKKMMAHLCDMPLVEYIYKRCKTSSVKKVTVATSNDKSDDIIYKYCKNNDMPVMRGSLHNVLDRYIRAAELIGAEYIARVCGDTPFVDIFFINRLLQLLIDNKLDYVSFDKKNCAPCFFSEAVTLNALKRVSQLTTAEENLEHVTKFIIDNRDKFSTKLLTVDLNPEFIQRIRLTIDFPEDILKASSVLSQLKNKFSFTSQDILSIVYNQGT